jgi:HlyD family secretion protein
MSRRSIVLALVAIAPLAWELDGSTTLVVTGVPATLGTIERRTIVKGTLEVAAAVQVVAPVAGEIDAVNVEPKSAVTAGQVLARIDAAAADQQVRDAEAAFAAAELALSRVQGAADAARQRAALAERLTSAEMIARADLDATETSFDEANAEVTAAESEVLRTRAAWRQATAWREQTLVRSPIDGIVTSRNAAVGQPVDTTSPAPVLFTIAADLKQLRLSVRLDQSDSEAAHAGDPVTFEVTELPGEIFQGTVAELRPVVVGAAVIGYSMIVDVPNATGRLAAGLTASMSLRASRRDNVVRIPNRALAFRPQAELLDTFVESAAPAIDVASPSATGQPGEVWEYDGKQFIGIPVRTGISDGTWSELMSGGVHSGDLLATGATPERRSRD